MRDIETDRLKIRMIRKRDYLSFKKLLQDKDVMEFSSGLKSDEEVNNWILREQEQYIQNGYGQYAVVHKITNEIIGYCGLTKFNDVNGSEEIELGYRLLKSHWGLGYATEAASAVKTYALHNLKLNRLISIVSPTNVRSIGVLKKLGMVPVGTVMLPGYSYPDTIYSISGS